MILPYSTDAPIYHWPFATVGMIILNTILLFVTPAAVEAGYALQLGDGIHPLQWLTHNFLHGGIMHLVGNMMFLWVFGLIVEGKIGAIPFLIIYLLMGVCHGATVQLACLHVTPIPALGASSIIFGLMAIAMIWAPKNDLQCLVFFGFGFRGYGDIWDIPIVAFAIFDIGWELFDIWLSGMVGWGYVGSAMLHLSGAFWGLIVGIAMVKLRLVDCENWDIFAVLEHRVGKAKSEVRASRAQPVIFERDGGERNSSSKSKSKPTSTKSGGNWEKTPQTRAADSMRKIQKQLEARDTDAMRDAYIKARENAAFEPDEKTLIAWIKELHTLEAWKPSMPFMRDYLRRFPQKGNRVRLRLAQVLLREQRPTQALREIEQVKPESLDPSLTMAKRQLELKARELIEEGVLELEGDD
jgi:membrane associated rhomboid family serine protease